MNQMFGMNIEQIRALSGQLDAAGHEVEQILASLTKGLSVTPWKGNDRTRFEHEWQTAHTAGLRNAAAALHQAARGAKQSADEQHRASEH
ncbi:hypothetical protein [Aeromicrobium fastidiosum]|uniref:WXG100 family type VII secretion target n=1 Tax=Aeromicrobium fastidiosum TaxID=52699 RepID=A0A641AIG7_9ACTN|nr:hypothetical protein [Aeromicrobium fastidiosum]KAA1374679.1 hypothetical protein ESP62_014905 [Aeromicrobium fastidiosum]MBP2390774.1 uncharacterized protein YukE [Aeromicrobium fastidiosum]